MKLLFSVCTLSAVLMFCEGKPQISKGLKTSNDGSTQPPTTTAGPVENLKGKMVTLSSLLSDVTFYRPGFTMAAGERSEEKPNTTAAPTATTARIQRLKSTPPTPQYRGVSVCLRFMADMSDLPFFRLFTLSPSSPLSLSVKDSWYYTLDQNDSLSRTSLQPVILWSSVRTEPWTSVCVLVDLLRDVVQVFQGGYMSVRKIPSFWRMVWNGEPVLKMPGFDGQVTDLEVWDYHLQYREVFEYMQNYGSSGTVLTWSNITYKLSGDALVEDAYPQRMRLPISSSEGENQPMWNEQGRDQQLNYRKKLRGTIV